jgi:hypothetical protein
MSGVLVRAVDRSWNFSRSQLVRYFPYFTSFIDDLEGDQREIDLPHTVPAGLFDILQACIVTKSTERINKWNFPYVLEAIPVLMACEGFDELLADAVDRGTIFFTSSRRKISLNEEEGELFAESAVILWKYDNYFSKLRVAFNNLLVWVSARAVHAGWFTKLPFQMIVGLPLSQRSVGLEGDITLIVLHKFASLLDAEDRLDMERDFSVFAMRTLLATLSSLRSERREFPTRTFQFYRDIVKRWSDRCGVDGSDVVNVLKRAAGAIFGEEADDDDQVLYTETSMDCARNFLEEMQKASSIYLCKGFVHQNPSPSRYSTSNLICHDDVLWEYNSYVGAYRLLSLPPVEVIRDAATQRMAMVKPNEMLSLTFSRRMSSTTEPYCTNVWWLDLSVLHTGYTNYKWRKVGGIENTTDEVVIPRTGRGTWQSPTIFFYKRNGIIGSRWWLHAVEKSKSIKFDTKCKTFSAASHLVRSSDLYEEGTDERTSVAVYCAGWQFNRVIVRDYMVRFDDDLMDKDIEVTYVDYPECPREFCENCQGGFISVFDDTPNRGPLIVSSTTVGKDGVFNLNILRRSGNPEPSYWKTITVPVTLGSHLPSSAKDGRFGGECRGRLNNNELVLWDAAGVTAQDLFKGRVLRVNLATESSRWTSWGADIPFNRKLTFEEIRQSLTSKMPVVVDALPVAAQDKKKRACLIDDRAFIPSSREGFWVPKSPDEDDVTCDIETLENIKWDTDYLICVKM